MSTIGQTAVVLAGGGARGAYEAGALATLLPALEQRGERPRMFIGTSAGAINAVLFGSIAHLPAHEAAQVARDVWSSIYRKDVVSPILHSGIKAGLQYMGQMFGISNHLPSILNAHPLAQTLAERMNWRDLHENIRTGKHLDLVAVSATSCRSGRSVIFFERHEPEGFTQANYRDDTRAIDYMATQLNPEHVMASAAIPVLFPPVHVARPSQAAGWYLDGGVRMNAPIKPALVLGAEKLLIVASDPLETSPGMEVGTNIPDVYDAVSHMLKAALADRMVEDVHTLRKMNAMLQHARELKPGCSASERPYRIVPWIFVGPRHSSHLGKMAEIVFQRNYGQLRWWHRHWDFPVLHQLIQGKGQHRGELMSYLFFHHEYMQEAFSLGQRDAERILRNSESAGLPWRTHL